MAAKPGQKEAVIQLGEESDHFDAQSRQAIAMGMADAFNQALETQPPQVVGHLGSGIGFGW
jgi:hypothetical protein